MNRYEVGLCDAEIISWFKTMLRLYIPADIFFFFFQLYDKTGQAIYLQLRDIYIDNYLLNMNNMSVNTDKC